MTEDFWNILDFDDDLDRLIERRSHCGKQAIRYFNPETGRYKKGVYRCDLWRDAFCQPCFERRVERLRGRAQRAVLDAWHDGERMLRIVGPMGKDEASRFVRSLPKSSYLRRPTADGDVILMDDNTGNGSELDYQSVTDLQWESLASTPEGRNVSGDLGKPENDEPEDGTFEVEVKSVVIHDDTSPEQEEAALLQAVEETADLSPTTPEEVQEAVKQRTDAFVKALKQAGGSILSSRIIKLKCQISCISWSSYTEKMQFEDLGVGEWARISQGQA